MRKKAPVPYEATYLKETKRPAKTNEAIRAPTEPIPAAIEPTPEAHEATI